MSSAEFYRGGSRSSFSAAYWDGAVTATSDGGSTTLVTSVSFLRMKRIQVTCMLAKRTGVFTGWMAFYREDPDTTTQVSGLAMSNPQVLRPKQFVTNTDHSVYLELYLEAITLDPGGKLHVMAVAQPTGAGMPVIMAAKWYAERQLP